MNGGASGSIMSKTMHRYRIGLTWSGNDGPGTTSYRSYRRDHELHVAGKHAIAGSADPTFRGDSSRWNPEELLVAALSACHQLWYLHLCAASGIVVVAYEDEAEGIMVEEAGGAGQFKEVVLRPHATVRRGSDPAEALALHHAASRNCFIARSVNFTVLHEPRISVAG